MNSPREVLTRVETTIALLSITCAQLHKIKSALEVAINTGELVTPNVSTLQAGVVNAMGGGRAAVDQVFVDWKIACGLGANGEAKVNGDGHVNGHMNGDAERRPRLGFSDDNDWLKTL